ncbi:hypothetical protein HMSSN139_31590 [Paenibacillus sp. HMSSN-139]|nr:hypothetical protein HMSSN139_31590 [Paenibacillus sp. HMSSN-139]
MAEEIVEPGLRGFRHGIIIPLIHRKHVLAFPVVHLAEIRHVPFPEKMHRADYIIPRIGLDDGFDAFLPAFDIVAFQADPDVDLPAVFLFQPKASSTYRGSSSIGMAISG